MSLLNLQETSAKIGPGRGNVEIGCEMATRGRSHGEAPHEIRAGAPSSCSVSSAMGGSPMEDWVQKGGATLRPAARAKE